MKSRQASSSGNIALKSQTVNFGSLGFRLPFSLFMEQVYTSTYVLSRDTSPKVDPRASVAVSRTGSRSSGLAAGVLRGPCPSRRQLRLRDRPRCVDQPDVAEGLGEVPQQLARGLVDLLGQQAHVVGEGDRALEHLAGPVHPAGSGQRLGH